MNQQNKPEANHAELDITIKSRLGNSGCVVLVPINCRVDDCLVYSGVMPQFVIMEDVVEHNEAKQRPGEVAK